MTFSYTDPTDSDKDAVRFLLGDTTSATAYLQDEEIEFLLAKWMPLYDSVEYAAAVAASTIAARFAAEANYSADGVSISLGNLAQQFRDLAASLREQHKGLLIGGKPDVGGIAPDEERDPTVKDTDFGTGMHDNPEVGRQNYGRGYTAPYYDPYNQPGA